MQIFVGNLSFAATEADVKKAFEGFGSVASVVIVTEKKSKKSRGFGFVDMPDDQQAQVAIAALDTREFMGRFLNVSPAHPKPEKGWDIRIREEVQKDAGFNPVFHKKGGYRGGRRSLSFMKRRAAAVIKDVCLERKNKENPMRWRKKQENPKPWQKSHKESNAREHQSRFKRRGKPGYKR
jgi:RNA recognition motif-containing protein